jgi:methionyl-tRNA formyltransferase
MRIIIMGTPDFAVPTLQALYDAGHDIAAVYCQPPRAAGRGKKLRPSPMQACAEALGIMVQHPASLKNAEAQAEFAALKPDIAVVAAYGLILPQAILDMPVHGCLNVHGSLLPRWRGAAPVQRAILAGDDMTGVTIMQMEAGLDTGPMLAKSETPIAAKNAGELTDEIAQMGADLMVQVVDDLPAYPPRAQPDIGVTYAQKIAKAEGRINFDQKAADVERQIRAFTPWPGAFFEHEGTRYRIHKAQIVECHGAADNICGTLLDDRLTIKVQDGAMRPVIIQKAGKPAMALDDFLRGNVFAKGTLLQ